VAPQNFSYGLFELAFAVASFLVIFALGASASLATKRFGVVLAVQYLVWIAWDYLAVRFDVFRFPREGSMPFRLFGLPMEEHLFFPLHSLVTWSGVILAETANQNRR
jgi:lycopene cyclase domain-containing protein